MLNSRELARLLLLYVILSTFLFGFSFTPSGGEENYTRTIRFWTDFGTKQVEVSYTIPHSKFEYYYNAPHLSAEANVGHFSYYVVSDSLVTNLASTLRSMVGTSMFVLTTLSLSAMAVGTRIFQIKHIYEPLCKRLT